LKNNLKNKGVKSMESIELVYFKNANIVFDKEEAKK
jgi:hypothetical protein